MLITLYVCKKCGTVVKEVKASEPTSSRLEHFRAACVYAPTNNKVEENFETIQVISPKAL
jgi:hypothetical protein